MDILKAVYEDTEEYNRLCRKFNTKERPDGVYDGHRKELLDRERKEEDAIKKRAERAFRRHAREISQIIIGENYKGEPVVSVYATSEEKACALKLKEA